MISIFNGRKRTLGGAESQIFAQVGVDFRDYLHLFKGAPLGVFLAIALHADENGIAWPSYALLQRETGYTRETIARALSDLCALEIDGHRVLTRWQPVGGGGKFQSNRYLIFPSTDELATVSDLPCTENPYTVKPNAENPNTENPNTKENHPQPEPSKAEPKEAEPAAAAGSPVLCSLHHVAMQERSKNDERWYSHKLADGTWCKGTPGDGKPKAEPLTATCPGCYLVGYADRLCPDCGRCPDCCQCDGI